MSAHVRAATTATGINDSCHAAADASPHRSCPTRGVRGEGSSVQASGPACSWGASYACCPQPTLHTSSPSLRRCPHRAAALALVHATRPQHVLADGVNVTAREIEEGALLARRAKESAAAIWSARFQSFGASSLLARRLEQLLLLAALKLLADFVLETLAL